MLKSEKIASLKNDATTCQFEKSIAVNNATHIIDNRPSTVYQLQLKDHMFHRNEGNTVFSFQRQASGNSKFQKIAQQMGHQYGVDTSVLKATHNSPFPAQLNAAATIQGNQIHFGPGMDTTKNIRHEVAHAIDNTLNGIPKGNHIANGQKIDTSRESVVDRMVNDATIQRQSFSKSVSKFNHSQNTPIQLLALDTEIDKSKLNVIGENHPETDARLKDEKLFALAKFGRHYKYWREASFNIKANGKIKRNSLGRKAIHFGDDYVLRFYYEIANFMGFVGLDMMYKNDPIKKFKDTIKYIEEMKTAWRNLMISANPVSYGLQNWDDQRDLIRIAIELKTNMSKGYDELEGQAWIVRHNTLKYEFLNLCKQRINQSNANVLNDQLKQRIVALEYYAPDATDEDMARLRSQARNILKDERSYHMDRVARQFSDKKGIWKIGDAHVTDIVNYENQNNVNARPYNLISKDRYNVLINNWRNRPYAGTKKFILNSRYKLSPI